jgi:hypothetical protein
MNKNRLGWFLAILWVTLSVTAHAGNQSFTGTFDGTEPTMRSTTGSCEPGQQFLPYQVVGDLQVDATGEYRLMDLGNNDMTLLLYDGAFDPENPQTNLHAAVDFFTFDEVGQDDTIVLNAGMAYTFVAQLWCEFVPLTGPWGAVMDGPGNITGAGFPTNPDLFGEFASVTNTASFPMVQPGTLKYVSSAFVPARSGNHLFLDISETFGGDLAHMLLYEGSFNPNDTRENLVSDLGHGTLIGLDGDTNYVLVTADEFNSNLNYQLAIYESGIPGLQTHLNGAWFNPDTTGQGILFDYGPNTAGGFLFLAWFTFETAGAPTKASGTEAVGASDQRWLTGSGTGNPGATQISLSFSNTSGGAFNEETPPGQNTEPYGTGTLTIDDCNEILIDFELPESNSGSLRLERALGTGELETCYNQTGLGELRR